MNPKPRSSTAKGNGFPKPAAVKRAQGISETARLFLDVEEMFRRSQSQRLASSRYVE